MKIVNLQDFIPLAITSVAITTSPSNQTFKYNEFDQNNIQFKNELTQQYLNSSSENTYQDLLIKLKFSDHLQKWKRKTKFLSSPNNIVEDSDFQEILKLKESVVKYIAEELKEEPSYLVWALNLIYGFKISNDPNTTIEEASKKWIKFLNA